MNSHNYLRKIRTAGRLLGNRDRWPFLRRKIRRIFGEPEMVWDLTAEDALELCQRRPRTPLAAFQEICDHSVWEEFSSSRKELFDRARKRVAAAKDAGSVMGGGMEVDLLFNLVRSLKPERIIETGVAYGWSSLALLAGLEENKRGSLWSSNLAYAGMDCEADVGCVVPEELRAKWHLFRGPDSQMLPKIMHEIKSCQMVVYDSDKSYAGRRASYKLLWSILDVGGVFVSDDIADNLGFLHFAETLGQKPLIVEHPERPDLTKYVGILRKGDDREPRDIWF
jgi:predicted O-methyltransferase YrrM